MKRTIILLFVSIIFFTGCSKSSKQENAVQYMYSGGLVNVKQNEEMKKIFKKKYPDINIELIYVEKWDVYLRKILTLIAGNVPLDLIGVGSSQAVDYMRRDICLPLDEYMKNDPEWEKMQKDIYPQYLLDAVKYKDKTYALPGWQNVEVIYYNRKLFDGAGIKYPDETWDINKLLVASKKLTRDIDNDGRIDQYGIYLSPTLSTLWWFNGDYLDKTGIKSALNTAETVEAYQWYVDLKNKYHLMPELAGSQNAEMAPYQLFMTGKLAMFVGSHVYKERFIEINNFEWDVSIFPKGKYGQRRTFDNLCCFVILKTSKNPDKAWKLLKFLIGREYQELLSKNHNDMPVLKSVLSSSVFLEPNVPPRNKKVFVDSLQYSSTWPTNMSNEIMDVIGINLEPAILMPSPQKTVKEACEEAAKQVNVLLEKQIK